MKKHSLTPDWYSACTHRSCNRQGNNCKEESRKGMFLLVWSNGLRCFCSYVACDVYKLFMMLMKCLCCYWCFCGINDVYLKFGHSPCEVVGVSKAIARSILGYVQRHLTICSCFFNVFEFTILSWWECFSTFFKKGFHQCMTLGRRLFEHV